MSKEEKLIRKRSKKLRKLRLEWWVVGFADFLSQICAQWIGGFCNNSLIIYLSTINPKLFKLQIQMSKSNMVQYRYGTG